MTTAAIHAALEVCLLQRKHTWQPSIHSFSIPNFPSGVIRAPFDTAAITSLLTAIRSWRHDRHACAQKGGIVKTRARTQRYCSVGTSLGGESYPAQLYPLTSTVFRSVLPFGPTAESEPAAACSVQAARRLSSRMLRPMAGSVWLTGYRCSGGLTHTQQASAC